MVPWIFLKVSTQDVSFDKTKEIGLQSLKKNPSRKQTNVIQIGSRVVLFAFL